MIRVRLPNNEWTPRPHQMNLWTHLRNGGTRAMAVWHRRAGKDDVCLHHTSLAANVDRVGNYWHCTPEYAQSRKAIWTAINPHTGKRRIDEAFPHALRANTNDTEMFVRFKNGSTWQCIGSDRYDATVGSGAAGIVYSEWALANPSAWAYHRPMLEENNGWAAFITTPRGRNHAFTMFQHASQSKDWFAELMTAKDTGSLTDEALAEAEREYIALYGEDVGRAQMQQEYYCNFQASILGAFYSLEMASVRAEGRVDNIEALPDALVHRAWDLGVTDDTSIWWFQIVGAQVFVLDCYSASGVGVEHYAEEIKKREVQHGWRHGTDFVPHDAKIKEWGSGRTRIETMQALGLRPFLVPMASMADGINAVRRTLPLCVFHPRCEEQGISALEQYRREYDDEKKCFRATAVHDWCFTGDTKVLTRYGAQRLDDLSQTGEVLTPCGWKRYHSPRVTRRNARLVEVRFTDGLSVRCTPDHLFATASGWKSAECLTSTTSIQSCLTLSRSISMAGFTAYFRVRCITRAAARSCTERLGQLRLVLFPRTATFTTATAICGTTVLPILSASTAASIAPRSQNAEPAALRQKLERLQLTGTSQRLGGFGTSGTRNGKRAGSSGSGNRWLARLAERSLAHLSERAAPLKSIAARIVASRDRVVTSVKPLDERADVWCMTVPDGECFALANGAVVHNCSHPSDAFRYLSLSWRHIPRQPIETKIEPGSWIIPPPTDERDMRGLRL